MAFLAVLYRSLAMFIGFARMLFGFVVVSSFVVCRCGVVILGRLVVPLRRVHVMF